MEMLLVALDLLSCLKRRTPTPSNFCEEKLDELVARYVSSFLPSSWPELTQSFATAFWIPDHPQGSPRNLQQGSSRVARAHVRRCRHGRKEYENSRRSHLDPYRTLPFVFPTLVPFYLQLSWNFSRQVFPEKMAKSLTPDMLATDLAEYLVRKGVSLIPLELSTSRLWLIPHLCPRRPTDSLPRNSSHFRLLHPSFGTEQGSSLRAYSRTVQIDLPYFRGGCQGGIQL